MKRLLPLLVFVAIALTGIAAAGIVWVSNRQSEQVQFAAVAEEATNRVEARIARNMLLIEATAALFEAKASRVSAGDFATYVRSLRLPERQSGIAGLGYSAFVRRDEREALARAVELLGGGPLEIWPETGEEDAAVVVLFESIQDRPPATGYDAYSEGARRVAIDRAIAERVPQATEPIQLVRDTSPPQPGFVVFAPVYARNFGIDRREAAALPTGFVFGGFRIGELLESALAQPPRLPLHLSVFDGDDADRVLFDYGEPATGRFGTGFDVTHRVTVAGQEWRLEFTPTAAFNPSSARYLTLLLAGASLMIAAFGAGLLRAQAQAHQNAELLAVTTQQNLVQKELMLQEMKHRIKNAIARILAIARQTAAGAEDLDGFTETFTQRLQAMSSAQDMLTRSTWQHADLRALILEELSQVFGPAFDAAQVAGPQIEIDEQTTQALGLTFHELATNALKYCKTHDGCPDVAVAWHLERGDGATEVVIDWRERCAEPIVPPRETGFGTRLIEANVRHDLKGRIEREYLPEGLRLRLVVPLAASAAQPGAGARRGRRAAAHPGAAGTRRAPER